MVIDWIFGCTWLGTLIASVILWITVDFGAGVKLALTYLVFAIPLGAVVAIWRLRHMTKHHGYTSKFLENKLERLEKETKDD